MLKGVFCYSALKEKAIMCSTVHRAIVAEGCVLLFSQSKNHGEPSCLTSTSGSTASGSVGVRGRAVRRLVPLGEHLLHLPVVLLITLLRQPASGRARHRARRARHRSHVARVPLPAAAGPVAITTSAQGLGGGHPRGDVAAVVGAGRTPEACRGVGGQRVESRVGRGGCGQSRAGVDDVWHPVDQPTGGGAQVQRVLRGVGRDVGRDLRGGAGRVGEARVAALLGVAQAAEAAEQVEVLAHGARGVRAVAVPEPPGCAVERGAGGDGGGRGGGDAVGGAGG